MSQYRTNLQQWWSGWQRFHEVRFKDDWDGEQARWKVLYAINYGTRVLAGGACVSWSRWFFEMRHRYGLAQLATRLLNLVDDDHGREAGPPLWATADTAWAARGAVVFFFLVVPLLGTGVFLGLRLVWQLLRGS